MLLGEIKGKKTHEAGVYSNKKNEKIMNYNFKNNIILNGKIKKTKQKKNEIGLLKG